MIPAGWREATAEELCSRISVGIVIKPTQYYVDEEQGVRAFRSANIGEGFVRDRDWIHISEDGHGKNKKSALKANDILIVRTGYPGTACLLPPEYEGSNCIDIIFARPDPEQVVPAYLCTFTNSEYGKKQVLDGSGGLAQQHFNVGAYKKLKLPLPPLFEQKRIAETLHTWDRAIETVEALIANARAQKQALMQQLLPQGTTPPKKRLPGFSGEWDRKSISEIANRITERNDGTELPVLTISSTSGFVRQDAKYSRFMAGKSVETYIMLNEGEFAYNKGNSKTYEFGCIFDLEGCARALVPHVYVCFKLKKEYSHRFYKALFEADYLAPQLGRLVNTGVRNNGLLNIKPSEFLGTMVPVPPLDEQDAIAAVMEAASRTVIEHEAQLTALRQEKAALMQQLLTGKRRVRLELEAETC